MTSDNIIEAYRAGKDCGENGPNLKNCHYTHFATPEQTKAWERGKAQADAVKDAKKRIENGDYELVKDEEAS